MDLGWSPGNVVLMAAEFCGWLKFLYIDFISCASAGLDFIYHETVQYPIALFFYQIVELIGC